MKEQSKLGYYCNLELRTIQGQNLIYIPEDHAFITGDRPFLKYLFRRIYFKIVLKSTAKQDK